MRRGHKLNALTMTTPKEYAGAFVINKLLMEHGLLDEQTSINWSRTDKISVEWGLPPVTPHLLELRGEAHRG